VKLSLATRLQATYLLVILIFLFIAGFYLHQTLKRFYIDQTTEQLFSQARLIMRQIGPPKGGRHNDRTARSIKASTGSRVTFIGPQGAVRGDSDESSAVMGNHLYRPEVQQALHGSRGVSIRHSETVDTDFLYVALPIREGEELRGFIRLALPLTELKANISTIRKKFFYAFLAASLIAVVIGYTLSKSITRPISDITRFTQRIAEGRFGEHLKVASGDEVGQLARQVNEMATELERTIRLIQNERNKAESILKSLNDAVLVIDDGGRIISANPAAESLMGVREVGLKGRSLNETLRNPGLEELFNRVRSERRSATELINLKFPEETELEVTVAPVENETEAALLFIITARDITRLQRLEQMRVDFVANVSHELRSPLTAIRGFIETLQNGAIADGDAAERFLRIMETQADRLTRLLDDLLTLSNIELGKVELHRRSIELRTLVEDCFATLEPKAAAGGITMNYEEPEGCPPAYADRDRLMQILLNLVDNAIKFTPAGGSVTVSALPLPAGDEAPQLSPGGLEIVVSDTGIGIPESDLPRISERFYRVDQARSRELGGTGLGLAIVKLLVMAHGGSFRIDSELRKGTSVRFTLPGVN
jgi:two-component system phosphate regulon sensor histidine kinase PhoR